MLFNYEKNKIVIAVDPGYDRVGVAILDVSSGVGKEKLVYSTCLMTNNQNSLPERLKEIHEKIMVLIDKHSPGVLAIENLYFTTNKKTAMGVAEAKGVVVLAAQINGLEIFEYSPPEIKLAITGHGSSDKTQIGNMVRRLVGFKKTNVLDDELDAIAIGLTHNATHRSKYKNL